MEPSHFRGSQPPAAYHFPGHPPQFGIMNPPFVIPEAVLTEIVAAIRQEISAHGRDINSRFSSVNQGYSEMNSRFDESVRQTDKISAEQGARLEKRLEGIQNAIRQLGDSQTAAAAAQNERLAALESLTSQILGTISEHES